MRKVGISLVGTLLLVQSAMAQAVKSDREYNGLKGKVHSVIAQSARLSNKDGQWVEGQPQLSYNESYDEQGNLTERISFDYRGNMSEQLTYSVIGGDKTAKIKYFHHDYDPPPEMAPPPAADAKPRDPRYDQRYKYRYAGNKVEMTLYYSDGSAGTRTVKTFDEKGNEVKWELYTRDGKLNFSSESKYDEKGDEVETTYYHADGRVSSSYRYTDDEVGRDGNWIKRKAWQSKDGKAEFVPYQVERRTISYYGQDAAIQPGKGGLPKVIRLSEGVLKGRAIKRAAPAYPPGLVGMVAGEVLIEVTVDEQGNVISAKGISGDKTLADLAIEAVKQWKFTPMKMAGEPVKMIGRIRFSFNR